VIASLVTMGHAGAVGPLGLLWTGKAVISVWAGFTWAKVGYLWDGVAAYLLGVGITTIPNFPGWDAWRFLSVLASLIIAIIALRQVWPQRSNSRVRALLTVFGGTFVAGEIFNLYAQPQDPQMQVNVMGWLTAGWALALVAAQRRWGPRALGALTAATVALLAYNVWSLAPLRGQDSQWQRTAERLERDADPARTVFLLHDFDWTMVYAPRTAGFAEVQVDRLHRRRAAPSRLDGRTAGRDAAAPDRPRLRTWLRGDGRAAVGHEPRQPRSRDRHGCVQPPARCAARPAAQELQRHACLR
jgi:hypothetical protein